MWWDPLFRDSPFMMALGKNTLHSGCWQNAIPCSFTTEDPVSLLAVSQGPPSFPINPSPSSSPLLLAISDILWPPAWECCLLLRDHVILFNQYNIMRVIAYHRLQVLGLRVGCLWGITLEYLFTRLPYVSFLLRRLLNATALPLPNQEIITCPLLPAQKTWLHIIKPNKVSHLVFRYYNVPTEITFQEIYA